MQVDFHHGVTYVVSRLAGLTPKEAKIVAHSAQYVDDATNDGTINFDNGALYKRMASAHKMIDYRNFEDLANHYVWIPFHFLPGNGGLPKGQNPNGSFIEKLICRPNSYVAQDMVRACISERDKPYGLHRLGITMHVYADTWAHQGFAGVSHEVNDIRALDTKGNVCQKYMHKMVNYFQNAIDEATSQFVGAVNPLGHGAVLSYPDMPYKVWTYQDHQGKTVRRDNPTDFLEAANGLCMSIQRFIAGDPDADVPGLSETSKQKMDNLFRSFENEDGDVRHAQWLEKIAKGYWSFGKENVVYNAKGQDSWKFTALGTTDEVEKDDEIFPYSSYFLKSDWKLFHDALQAHRFAVISEILPQYGILAA